MGIASPIVQVVGYQNSGKTVFITTLIKKLTELGLHVGTIKHHGHGGKPKLSDEGKDSFSHRQEGAITTCVEGDGNIVLTSTKDTSWSLHELLHMYSMLTHDIILIEGYKKENYPKIVCLRSHEDLHLLSEVENILAVIMRDPFLIEKTSFPVFMWGEQDRSIEWVVTYIRGKIHDRKGFSHNKGTNLD